jgi:hypothetical protein
MIRWSVLWFALAVSQLPPGTLGVPQSPARSNPSDKSAYFAFADREYIFTIEVVAPGIPLINFISMSDQENNLLAREVRLTLENRKVPGKFFLVETGDAKQPVILPSLRMHPRSSFGMRLQGEFGEVRELSGAVVRIGLEDFKMAPLTSFEFESLVLKANRINLGSPDITDDWRVLKLEVLGSRVPVRR